jgi:hypothetical protein
MTAAGGLKGLQMQMDKVKESIGQGVVLAVDNFLEQMGFFDKKMALSTERFEQISRAAYRFGTSVTLLATLINSAWTYIQASFEGLKLGFNKLAETAVSRVETVVKGFNKIGLVSDETLKSLSFLHEGFASNVDDSNKKLAQLADDARVKLESVAKAYQTAMNDTYDATNQRSKEAKDVLDRITGAMGHAAGITKELTDEQIKAIDEQKKKLEQLEQGYTDITRKSNEFSFTSVEDFTRFGEALADTVADQKEWLKTVSQGFSALQSKIQSVDKDIESLNNRLDSAKKSFADFIKSAGAEASTSFAKIVHDAEKSIPDLEQKITDATARLREEEEKLLEEQRKIEQARREEKDVTRDTKSEEKAVAAAKRELEELQQQLAGKNKILKTYQSERFQQDQDLALELKFLRELETRDELEQAFALFTRKMQIRQDEYIAEVEQINRQIAEKERERQAYQKAQEAMTLLFKTNVDLRNKYANEEIGSLQGVTKAVNDAASAYQRMAALRGSSGGLIGRASGGPVDAGTPYIVGEQGPEIFTPSSNGMIIPNHAVGGVTINIHNPTVRNDSDIAAIRDQILSVLSRQQELTQMGALA